ncbi:MAG: glycosyltransferase [Janthinobacterium lividum]
MTNMGLAVFTICSNNYVPMARILIDSALAHHPDATVYLCLADTLVRDPDFYPSNCVVVPAATLGIPDFESFAFRYDVMEFNTALKPFMFRHLLAAGFGAVLYFDPDIEIFRRLDPVLDALRDGASFTLTPHICRPAEGEAYPDDIGIMRAGVFNLGFLGVGAGAEAESVLRWWSRRLQYQCINDQPGGIFVDQKFMDLVPGFAENARILRDTTLNVAYWNLTQRTLAHEDGTWLVDGRPLGFFHYSGFDPRNLARLTKHTDGFQDPGIPPDLLLLMQHYAHRLLANGHGTVPAGLYGYGRFRSGTTVSNFVRRRFREDHVSWGGDPFDTFEEYLNLSVTDRWSGPASACMTQLMAGLHEHEPWLRSHFDPQKPGSARDYVGWFLAHSEHLVGDPRLVEPVAERLGDLSMPPRQAPARRTPTEPEIDVVGYLRLALGVGEAARLTLKSLNTAGISARGVAVSFNSGSIANDTSCDPLLAERSEAAVQVFGINADQIGHVIDHLGDRLRPDSYRIITPFWELSKLPEAWTRAFDHVDEVWAPTRFIQTMLTRSIDKPVVRMPLVLGFEAPERVARLRFNLPENRFLFFFAFDYLSYIQRKNPLAVVEAFRRAFRAHGRNAPVSLVLKTLNSESDSEAARMLRESLQENLDVILIERTLSRSATLALIDACDAVVSLHRSEGLGLLVAEAMVLGKPVISTDYSATTELVSPGTGYPVDYRLIPVRDGEYPFHEGQHWADADVEHAAWQMREVFGNPQGVAERVAAARAHLRANYGQAVVSGRQNARLRLIRGSP